MISLRYLLVQVLRLGHILMKSPDFFYLDIGQSEDCISKGTSHETCAKLSWSLRLNTADRAVGTLFLITPFTQNFILGIYGKCLWHFRILTYYGKLILPTARPV